MMLMVSRRIYLDSTLAWIMIIQIVKQHCRK
jgi:hypothetical protein